MDYATNDLVLAIVHHLLVFTLVGILAFEIGTVRLAMTHDEILRVGRIDNWYGILAGVNPGDFRGQRLGLLRG
jgi:putative membrane protein